MYWRSVDTFHGLSSFSTTKFWSKCLFLAKFEEKDCLAAVSRGTSENENQINLAVNVHMELFSNAVNVQKELFSNAVNVHKELFSNASSYPRRSQRSTLLRAGHPM